MSLPAPLSVASDVSMPRLCRVAAVLLLFCVLVAPTLGDNNARAGRAKRPVATWKDEDDFTLTAEQERLLFEDAPTSFPVFPSSAEPPQQTEEAEVITVVATTDENLTVHKHSTPHSAAAPLPAQHSPTLPSILPTPHPAAALSSPIRADSDSCPDDFGGVSRLLSALVSPSAIRGPGYWSIRASVSDLDYVTLARLLRTHKPQDALDLLTLGERLLTSATYQPATDTYQKEEPSAWREGPLSVGLVWVQYWVAQLERLLHHKLVAPLHLPSTASALLHGALVLLLPTALFVALMVTAPVVINAVSPRTGHRSIRPARPPSSSNGDADVDSNSSLISASAAVPSGRRGLNSRSVEPLSSESFASALWVGLLLLLLTLFTAGYVHHYHALHVEQLARNRIIQSNPPPGCYQTNEPASLSSFLTSISTYLTRSQRDDACWRYEASLLQSSWPNPLLVLSSYLSTVLLHPLSHVGEALGGFTHGFLSHHSIVMQGVMLAFLLLFSLGLVALCMLGGKACLLRWCTGCCSSGRRSGSREGRAVRGGRRLREGSVRIEELIEGEDGEWEEEEEIERRRLLKRLLKEHRRREDEKQLLLLMSGQRQQQKADEGDEDDEKVESSRRRDGVDRNRGEREREGSGKKSPERRAVGFRPEAKDDSPPIAELDEKSGVKQEHKQQQQQTVKKEQHEQQAGHVAASPSVSSPTSTSLPTSQYSYPVARPSSRGSSDSVVKDEDALEWSGNPLS